MSALAADQPERRGVIRTADGVLHVGDAVRRRVGSDGAQAGVVVAPELIPGVRALWHGPAGGGKTYAWVDWGVTSTATADLTITDG